jgi:hypothetical protein
METLNHNDILGQIFFLQERLVTFYAIQSDVECEEAKQVLQIQIDNYSHALEDLQNQLLKLKTGPF